jgi:hypothetical protein
MRKTINQSLILAFGLGVFVLAACSAFVDVVDVNTVPQAQRAAASQVRIFMVGQGSQSPQSKYIGPVEAYSCKNKLWDKPASQANALEQLKIKAYRMGAASISDVTCTTAGTDAYGTNCWNTVQCGGTAFK